AKEEQEELRSFRTKGSSGREQCKTIGEDQGAARNVLRQGILIGSVAPTIATRDKKHGGRRDAGHEERVVIGAADHFEKRKFVRAASLGEGVCNQRRTVCRRVRVEQFGSNRDTAFQSD